MQSWLNVIDIDHGNVGGATAGNVKKERKGYNELLCLGLKNVV